MNQKTLTTIFLLIALMGNSTNFVSSSNNLSVQETSDWQWSATELVSTESNSYLFSPSIAIDSSQNTHVVWFDTSSGDGNTNIVYKKYTKSTQLWSTTKLISTESTMQSIYPQIAIDSKDNIHVVWNDITDYNGSGGDSDIFYKKYIAEQQLWSTTEVISTSSADQSIYPQIAIDSKDYVHVVWNEGAPADINYKKYDSIELYWSVAKKVSIGIHSATDRPSIAIDSKDNIHIVWQDYSDAGNDYDIYYIKYNITAQIWSEAEIISTESTSTSYSATIAIDSKDNIYVAWHDRTDYENAGEDADIFYKKYNETTQVWSTTEVISTESENTSQFPSIAIDTDDNLHLVWQEYGYTKYYYDVIYKKFDINTQAWSTAEVISTESIKDSRVPSITTDSENIIHVVWADNTNYNSMDRESYDIFYKKYSPAQPTSILKDIQPNPGDGTINLEWENFDAVKYKIYRDVIPILSTNGLSKIAETTNPYYADELTSNGTYYYVITTANTLGSIQMSNIVSVEVVVYLDSSNETPVDTEVGFLDFPIPVPIIFGLIPIIIRRRKLPEQL